MSVESSPAQKIERLIDRIMSMFVNGVCADSFQTNAAASERAEVVIRGALRIFMSRNFSEIFENSGGGDDSLGIDTRLAKDAN